MNKSSNIPNRLHIGCFDKPVNGWHNTDISPHLFVARIPGLSKILYKFGKMDRLRYEQHRDGVFRRVEYLSLNKKFPYPDNHFEFVFSCHVFEHIPRPVLEMALLEIRRVMKSGGVMRIVVPDLSWFVKNYTSETADDFVRGVFEIEHGLEKNRHQWMYSHDTLRVLLESAGFVNVEAQSFRNGKCPNLSELDNRKDHSIFMECEKR